jgi:glycyl-tRNA synthetase (class II)
VHAKATKTDLIAREVYPEVREEEVTVVTTTTSLIGRTFKQEAGPVTEALKAVRWPLWFGGVRAGWHSAAV